MGIAIGKHFPGASSTIYLFCRVGIQYTVSLTCLPTKTSNKVRGRPYQYRHSLKSRVYPAAALSSLSMRQTNPSSLGSTCLFFLSQAIVLWANVNKEVEEALQRKRELSHQGEKENLTSRLTCNFDPRNGKKNRRE